MNNDLAEQSLTESLPPAKTKSDSQDVVIYNQIFDAILSQRLLPGTKLVEEDGKVEMQVFGRFGYDVYINPETAPKDFENMRALLQKFVNEYLLQVYAEKIKAQGKILDDLRDDEEDFQDDLSDLKSDIQDNKEDIEELKKENEEYTKEMVDLRKLSEIQNDKIKKAETEMKALKQQQAEVKMK